MTDPDKPKPVKYSDYRYRQLAGDKTNPAWAHDREDAEALVRRLCFNNGLDYTGKIAEDGIPRIDGIVGHMHQNWFITEYIFRAIYGAFDFNNVLVGIQSVEQLHDPSEAFFAYGCADPNEIGVHLFNYSVQQMLEFGINTFYVRNPLAENGWKPNFIREGSIFAKWPYEVVTTYNKDEPIREEDLFYANAIMHTRDHPKTELRRYTCPNPIKPNRVIVQDKS